MKLRFLLPVLTLAALVACSKKDTPQTPEPPTPPSVYVTGWILVK